MMDYPLFISGVELGRLVIEQQGLFTVFEATCPPRDELIRLSVYGEGREAYLGLMQPWRGGLYLKRKLSRAQLQAFPGKIEYAAESGLESRLSGSNAQSAPRDTPNESGGELTWTRAADGTLLSHDGKSRVLALPCALRSESPGPVIRRIDGQTYMLFRY